MDQTKKVSAKLMDKIKIKNNKIFQKKFLNQKTIKQKNSIVKKWSQYIFFTNNYQWMKIIFLWQLLQKKMRLKMSNLKKITGICSDLDCP